MKMIELHQKKHFFSVSPTSADEAAASAVPALEERRELALLLQVPREGPQPLAQVQDLLLLGPPRNGRGGIVCTGALK